MNATKKTILLVEDDETFRSVLKIFLTKHGFLITEAADGRQARSILALSSFDLILSDIRMPHLFGTELLQYVRKNSPYPQAPFVLMTGFSDIVEMQEAHALGASGFIAKPFKPDELLELIKGIFAPPVSGVTGAPVEHNSEDDYCSVELQDFLGSKVLRVDLFVRLNSNKFIRIARKGTQVLSDQIKNYHEKGITKLHILRKEFKDYVDFNVQVTTVAAGKDYLSAEAKMKILKHTQEVVLQSVYLSGLDKVAFDNAATTINSTLAVVSDDPSLFALINILNTHSDFLYAHSVAVATYSVLIAKEIGWQSPPILFRLALGGLLHDIGKKEIPREILEKPRALLTREDLELIESHGFRGKEILSSLPHVPSDVTSIALQHHENQYGGGPLRLKGPLIHPLAKVVSVANKFCELVIHMPNRELLAPLQAIEKLSLHSREEFDPVAFSALQKLFFYQPATKTA